jgi:hypothetical protein
MNEKPILFSSSMVNAIYAGNKTMTRRVINPQPDKHDPGINFTTKEGYQTSTQNAQEIWAKNSEGESIKLRQPYKKGDVLWVRETWKPSGEYYLYAADFGNTKKEQAELGPWKPSIFMPYEAARLFLEITSVKIERLQCITAEDAVKEGLDTSRGDPSGYISKVTDSEFATILFQGLWDALNAKRGYSWESNPWVWVYEFRRIVK